MNVVKQICEKANRKCKNLKIRTKFFIAYVSIALLLILLLGSVFQYVFRHIIYRNTVSFTGEFLEQLSYNLENQTESLMEMTYELMTDKEFLMYVKSGSELIAEDGIGKYRQSVRAIGSRHFSSTSPVSVFYVAGSGEELSWWVRYTKEFNSGSVNQEQAEEIIELARQCMGEKNTCWFRDTDNGQVYLARNMIDTKNSLGEVYGTVVFAVSPDFFCPIQSKNSLIDNESLVFVNHDSSMTCGNYETAEDLEEYINKKEERYGNYVSRINYQNEKYVFAERLKHSVNWNIYCFIPEQRFMKNAETIRWYIVGTAGGAVVLSLFISWWLSRNLSKNIHYLEKNMRKVEQGDFKIHIQPTSYDEIGMLCKRFNYMADKIEELIKEAYKEGQVKEKLKLQVLKAQINPHFLYNSLGSIRCMAKMKKQDDITEMTTALIELLRTSLSKTNEYHTVSGEIEYIRNYFILQNFRYENCFEVEYHLEEKTYDCMMLNFILQPLVENAIFHGIEISKGNGKIVITSSVSGGKLLLTVEDNGVGMTKEKIEQILSDRKEKYEGLNSIGVANVSQRIKHYFGEEYGLSYISEPGKGSIAEVWLPLFYTVGEVQDTCIN